MATAFTWIPLYCELAARLLDWESRQPELIAMLEQLHSEGNVVTPLNDKDGAGSSFLLTQVTQLGP